MALNKHEVYLANAVMQASKEELTLMLYNGAIKFCNLAIAAINDKNMYEAHKNIIKVQNIIREFQITLNLEYEVAQSFAVMYDYLSFRLVQANIEKNIEILEEINGHLREFRDTWKQAMLIAKGIKCPIENLA